MSTRIRGTSTGSGTNDNDQVILLDDAGPFDTFLLMSTAGAMDVFVSLDGTNYTTAPLSLADLGASDTIPVLVTVANRMYGFRGKYRKIKILQNGATAVEDAALSYGVM
jgi:hypothetical protein